MARTPGGPLSGGLEASNLDALEAIKQRQQEQQKAQQPESLQQRQERPQENAPSSRGSDRETAAKSETEKVLEQNDRVKESRMRELAERFAHKTSDREQGRDQQPQQQPDQRDKDQER